MVVFSGYKNKRVFITGHTGFKGSWLSLWLRESGAEVMGYALAPITTPNHHDLLKLDMREKIADIREVETLQKTVMEFKPDIVFHLAAQPLVRLSYKIPRDTFEMNVMGTVNVLEACRNTESVRAFVNITTDKCYHNRETDYAYTEEDPMGGYDPYSASKGCSELVSGAYLKSFFNPADYGKTHQTLTATARSGNVIGGGDWSEDRLIPDLIKGASVDIHVKIRSPHAIRPWQHVLEPLQGYLLLGEKLLAGNKEFSGAWNFGPDDQQVLTVAELTKKAKQLWSGINYLVDQETPSLHEAQYLKLNSSKARSKLGWKPLWKYDQAIEKTITWYRSYYETRKVLTKDQIQEYMKVWSVEHGRRKS